MARNIIIDIDTEVGYSYLRTKFYVTNKGTTTWRDTAEGTKTILDIVAPDNEVSLQDLNNLVLTLEKIKNLYYTWSPTGSFVASIQFNDYKDNILILDCPKKKMYFKNSNLLFDLSISERKLDRLLLICSYLKNKLGMEVTKEEAEALYDFLLSYYTPKVYNVLSSEENAKGDLMYSNVFELSNFSNTSKATYRCSYNPNNETYLTDVANIERMTADKSQVFLIKESDKIKQGDTVHIKGTTIDGEGFTYTNDGQYKINSISKDGLVLNVKPNIAHDLEFAYPLLDLRSSELNVSNVNRELSTITLTNTVPSSIKVGDVIYLTGTTREENYETVSADGRYTVSKVEESTITVQELFPANYTYVEESTYPIISKHIRLGNVKLIDNKVINLVENLTVTPEPSSKVILYRKDKQEVLTVETTSPNTITVQEEIENYTPDYPKIEKVFPIPYVLVDVTMSKREEKLPVGEFMVDNFKQCQQYIGTYSAIEIPKQDVFDLVNKPVPTSVKLSYSKLPKLELLGLFSEVYKEEDK